MAFGAEIIGIREIGIGRKTLLNILQHRAESLGVRLVFEREVGSDLDFPDADLVVAADGVNSKVRDRSAGVFKPDIVLSDKPTEFVRRQVFFTFEVEEEGGFRRVPEKRLSLRAGQGSGSIAPRRSQAKR